MPRYVAARHKISESIPGELGQFARLPERKDALGVKSHGKFGPQTGLYLRNGDSEATCHGIRDVEVKRHSNPATLSYVTLVKKRRFVTREGRSGEPTEASAVISL